MVMLYEQMYRVFHNEVIYFEGLLQYLRVDISLCYEKHPVKDHDLQNLLNLDTFTKFPYVVLNKI